MQGLLKEYYISLKIINQEIDKTRDKTIFLENSFSKECKRSKAFVKKKEQIEKNRYKLYLLYGMQRDLLFSIHLMKYGYPPKKG